MTAIAPPPGSSAALAAALQQIETQAETAVADLARLVAVDTSFPPGCGYDAFADLMEDLVAPLGLATSRVRVPEALWRVAVGPAHGNRTNLIARRSSGKPVLGLYFHVDTVPAADGWTSDPLRLRRDGDQLVALGAADMKGTIAAVLLALRAAEAADLALAYDPMLLACTDEEGGLYPGIRYLAEQGVLEGHILNFNGTAAARIWAGCFGMFNLLIRVHGQTVHVGEGNRTGAGCNAIEAAVPILAALTALKPVVARRTSALPPPPNAIVPLAGQLNIAAAHGGTSGGHLMPTSDPGGPHWARWQAALSAGFGYAPEDFATWGAASCSDFGWVQKASMQEVLLTGLGRPESCIHSPDEHTTVADIVALAKSVLVYLAADFRPDLNPDMARS
jgi:succinyl-diaminopimelate desuccinylase